MYMMTGARSLSIEPNWHELKKPSKFRLKLKSKCYKKLVSVAKLWKYVVLKMTLVKLARTYIYVCFPSLLCYCKYDHSFDLIHK